MVDKYAASVRVEVVMDVPVSVTGYDGAVTDEDEVQSFLETNDLES